MVAHVMGSMTAYARTSAPRAPVDDDDDVGQRRNARFDRSQPGLTLALSLFSLMFSNRYSNRTEGEDFLAFFGGYSCTNYWRA